MDILTAGEFQSQMRAFFIANQNNITDLNSGSALDTQFNAMSVQLNQALVKVSGGFKTQFEQIPFQTFDFQRKPELSASATEIFSRQTGDPVEITIPIGTIVGTSSGLLYTTTAAGAILSGNTSSSAIPITANEAGIAYDAQINAITVLNSSVPGVNSVTNNIAASGGRDKETNSEYFARFTNFILGLQGSNRFGIFTAAVNVATIQSAYVEDHFPPALGIYNFTAYVDDGSGSVPQDKLDEIYLEIYGNDTSAYQGWAAAGINFRVLTAGLIPVNIVYTAQIDPNVSTSSEIKLLIEAALNNYINSLWVGSDVLESEVIRILKGINGVVDIPSSLLTLNGGDNVTVTAAQVARVSSITPTITT